MMSEDSRLDRHLDLPRAGICASGLWLLARHLICQPPQSGFRGAARPTLRKTRSVCSVLSHAQLWDPMGCNPPGPSVRGVLQARVLERVAMSSSRGPSWLRDRTRVSCISCIAGGFFYPLSHLGGCRVWAKNPNSLCLFAFSLCRLSSKEAYIIILKWILKWRFRDTDAVRDASLTDIVRGPLTHWRDDLASMVRGEQFVFKSPTAFAKDGC